MSVYYPEMRSGRRCGVLVHVQEDPRRQGADRKDRCHPGEGVPASPSGAGGVPPRGQAAGAEVPPAGDPTFRPPGDDGRRKRP